MIKTNSGFSKTIGVPWGSKVIYKFLVDDRWSASSTSPQEYDRLGNLNNVYTSPPKPASLSRVPITSQPEAPKAVVAEATDSVLASHGTSSLVSYVTSGVGAAIANMTGIDPINSQQIPVPETPVSETPAPAAAPKPLADTLAPIVDEPVVLHLASDTAKSESSDPSAAPIPIAPEPYKEVNGKLPAELEHPQHSTSEEHARHSDAAHPSEVVHEPETTSTTTTAVASAPKDVTPKTISPQEPSFPRTSGGSPPTTPRKFSFQRSRGSVSGSIGSSEGSPSKMRKRDSFFGKIKEVFHHHDKKEKVSP